MSANKSEAPTSKRLRDARKKGQVAKSREITSCATIVMAMVFIWMSSDFYINQFEELVLLPASFYRMPFREALDSMLIASLIKLAVLSFAPLLAVTLAGVFSEVFQTGGLLTFEPMKPDLKKLSPASWFKKTFSRKNLVEFLKSILKTVFLGYLLYVILRDAVGPLMSISYSGIEDMIGVLGQLLRRVVIYTALAFATMAAADYFFQKKQHLSDLKMSKEEVKQEYKEMEGDPHIKGKRKQLHRELLNNNMLQNVKKATVIVTNPTEIAVALFYKKEETALPVVLAKGENLLAKKIIQIAQEENIPIMRNVPLARALYEQVDIDQYIPSDLIEPVAEVLRWVRQFDREK